MIKLIPKNVRRIILSLGLVEYRLRRLEFPGVAVLCYHGIRDDSWPSGTMAFEQLHVRARELEEHCRMIRRLCNPISLNDWRAALSGGPPLPKRPVLFTFDDGYRSVFTLARPVLKKYNIPAVVFLCHNPIEGRLMYWFDAVARASGEKEVERVKRLPYDEWKDYCSKFDMSVDDNDAHALLKKDEVVSLGEDKDFEIGGHSAEHVILGHLDINQQQHQIVRNKEYLEGLLSRNINAFAYPNGKPGEDYSRDTVKMVQDAGFDTAFSTRQGFADLKASALERPRFLILSGISAAELAWRLLHYAK